MKRIRCLAFLVVVGVIPSTRADVAVFDDAASFAAAVTGVQSFGFAGLAFPGSANFVEGNRMVGGATFSSPGLSFTIKAGSYGSQYGVDFFSGQSPDAAPSQVDVTFGGLFALSFEYGSYAATPGSVVTIALSSGQQLSRNLPATPGTHRFIGFVSTLPLDRVTFTTISNATAPDPYAYAMDIIRFQTALPVPEVDTWVLLLAGLATIGVARRLALLRDDDRCRMSPVAGSIEHVGRPGPFRSGSM